MQLGLASTKRSYRDRVDAPAQPLSDTYVHVQLDIDLQFFKVERIDDNIPSILLIPLGDYIIP